MERRSPFRIRYRAIGEIPPHEPTRLEFCDQFTFAGARDPPQLANNHLPTTPKSSALGSRRNHNHLASLADELLIICAQVRHRTVQRARDAADLYNTDGLADDRLGRTCTLVRVIRGLSAPSVAKFQIV